MLYVTNAGEKASLNGLGVRLPLFLIEKCSTVISFKVLRHMFLRISKLIANTITRRNVLEF